MYSQNQQGRKKVLRGRSAAYRKVAELQRQLESQQRLTCKYKKRLQRLTQKVESKNSKDDTPRKRTKKLLKCFSVSKTVHKQLLFHHAIVDEIRIRYRNSRSERVKQLLAQVLTRGIVRRCKLQSYAKKVLGIYSKWPVLGKGAPKKRQIRHGSAVAAGLTSLVQQFYERDDVSRITTGKKDTKTEGKIKKQKRILNDSMKNLHAKFLAEQPSTISYSLFCQLRPFWVVIPRAADRETCLCKLHSNFEFMLMRLIQKQVLTPSSLESIVESTACDPSSMDCMHGLCTVCKDKGVEVRNDYDKNEEVWWWQWVTKKESIEKKKGESTEVRKVQVTVKEKISGSRYDLMIQFQHRIGNMKRHVYNIRHQYQIYRKLRDNMAETECILHIDFAENYMGKYSSEIQSVHFGGSHKQVTLHTGVLYVPSDLKAQPFCTISDCMDHSPYAIWAYLHPVLKELKHNFSQVKVVHFFSDSPSTQYRQKKMFYLFCTKLYELGFSYGTWNYFESGHGKGAPDGVGGALKRCADNLVANGTDVPDASSFYRHV